MIFDKTDKGREEIATRKHHLSAKLRPLLVMIDGKHTADDLLKKVAGLGVDQHGLDELSEHGFIQIVATSPSLAPKLATDSIAAAPGKSSIPIPAEFAAAPPATTPSSQPAVLAEGETQMAALSHFFNETIKSTIGLRGFALQLKVERANSIDDFRALREPYLAAVLKAKGSEMAHSLRNRLDELLNLPHPPQ